MRRAALLAIRVYQGAHLAFFRGCCRFHPSCSDYAAEAVQVHGLPKGTALAAWRILRCQPLCKGGWDPVPPARAGRPPVPRNAPAAETAPGGTLGVALE